MILGLVKPTAGEVMINGMNYNELTDPIGKIGALIDGDAVNPELTARQHLDLIVTASGNCSERVAEILEEVGLKKVSDKKIKEFSLGMKQRIGIAAALLGDPETIILDEPFNGLDVDGIHWLRRLTVDLAREGRAVLVSSHLMSEVQAIAERIIVLGQGKLIADMTIEEMSEKSLSTYLKVRSENNRLFKELLEENGALIQERDSKVLHVSNIGMEEVGVLARENQLAIYELAKIQPSLEKLFVELTEGKVDYLSEERKGDRNE